MYSPIKSKLLEISSRSEEHTSELQSPCNIVCRLLLEKKKKHIVIFLTTVRYIFVLLFTSILLPALHATFQSLISCTYMRTVFTGANFTLRRASSSYDA